VRHGDKWREARQVPAPVYFERAQTLQVRCWYTSVFHASDAPFFITEQRLNNGCTTAEQRLNNNVRAVL